LEIGTYILLKNDAPGPTPINPAVKLVVIFATRNCWP
jgi:hypothetical protein